MNTDVPEQYGRANDIHCHRVLVNVGFEDLKNTMPFQVLLVILDKLS